MGFPQRSEDAGRRRDLSVIEAGRIYRSRRISDRRPDLDQSKGDVCATHTRSPRRLPSRRAPDRSRGSEKHLPRRVPLGRRTVVTVNFHHRRTSTGLRGVATHDLGGWRRRHRSSGTEPPESLWAVVWGISPIRSSTDVTKLGHPKLMPRFAELRCGTGRRSDTDAGWMGIPLSRARSSQLLTQVWTGKGACSERNPDVGNKHRAHRRFGRDES